jgi:putative aldouronate transport system substrate-binding protein
LAAYTASGRKVSAGGGTAAGTAGAYAHDVTPSTLGYIEEQFKKMPQNKNVKFEDVITILKPFKNADGNYYRYIASPAWSESYINAKCDDKKVDRILRLMNYVLDEKGYNLLHFGIEGTDYKKEGDKIVLTPQKDADGKDIALTTTYPICGSAFLMEWSGTRQWTNPTIYPKLQKMSSDMNDWLMANAKPLPTDLRIGYLDVPSKAKANAQFPNDLVKMILSKDVEKTFNEIKDAHMANAYTTYIEEINAKCAELGIKPQ